MRIMLLKSLEGCLARQRDTVSQDSPLPDTVDKGFSGFQDLPEIVNGILSSVPYLLGDVDQNGNLICPQQRKAAGAYALLWPLRLINHLNVIDSGQRAWIMERLTYIRNVFGIYDATEPVP